MSDNVHGLSNNDNENDQENNNLNPHRTQIFFETQYKGDPRKQPLLNYLKEDENEKSLMEKIKEENKKIMEKINNYKKTHSQKVMTKKLKMKNKDDIIKIVLDKLK